MKADDFYPTREYARSCSPHVNHLQPSTMNHQRSKMDHVLQASDLGVSHHDLPFQMNQHHHHSSPAFGPTRPLTKTVWLGNLPPQASTATMMTLFGNAATIESCRIIPHKNCGFVTFFTAEVNFSYCFWRFESTLNSNRTLHRQRPLLR